MNLSDIRTGDLFEHRGDLYLKTKIRGHDKTTMYRIRDGMIFQVSHPETMRVKAVDDE